MNKMNPNPKNQRTNPPPSLDISSLLSGRDQISVYLVRHGETSWNAQHLFQGQRDISLNQHGRDQAALIGDRLKHQHLGAIVTSGLKRAQETAAAISSHHALEVIRDPRFNEISFGEWEGKTYSTIENTYPQQLTRWYQKPLDFSAPGGESLLDLSGRVLEGFQAMIQSMDSTDFLLVAHGGPLQTLVCLLLHLPLENYWQLHLDNGSLSALTLYPEGAIINLLNDTCHLEKQ